MVISKVQAIGFVVLIVSIAGTAYFTSQIKKNNDLSGLIIQGIPSYAGDFYLSQDGICIGSAEVAVVRDDSTAYSLIVNLNNKDTVDLKIFFNAAGQVYRSELQFSDTSFTTNGTSPIDVTTATNDKFFVQGVVEFREDINYYQIHYIPRQLKAIKIPKINFSDDLSDIKFNDTKDCINDETYEPNWIRQLRGFK